jgi:uncharacterized protein involved in exopolysaccharide biosynthesis
MTSELRTTRDRLDRILALCGRATRFWLAALVTVFVGGLMALGVALTRPRIYKSETLILYREGIRSSDLGGPESGGDPARKLGLKLKEMVLSRTRLQQIIEEFKLYPSVVADRGFVDAVDEMRNHIAFRVKDGDTFGLSFEGEDRERVQQVTARLADALINENSQARTLQAGETKKFLDNEMKRNEADLRDRETALAKFLAKHPEFARETTQAGQAGTAIRAATAQPKGKTGDATLLALERQAGRIQERLGMPVPKRRERELSSDPKLLAEKQAAEAEAKAAQKELESKLAQFTDQHPDVKVARARAHAAEARLKQAAEALAAGDAAAQKNEPEPVVDRAALEAELKGVDAEIAAHKRKHESSAPQQAGTASWIVALETDWTRLNREVAEARERRQQLQDKQFKASMVETAAVSGQNAQMEIVDPAYKPTHPARPGRATIAGVGLAVALGLALALAFGLALIDDRLYDRVDVERLGLVPLVGLVPRRSRRG